MIHRRWWWGGLIRILMIAGAVVGCSGGGDQNDGHPASRGCVLVGEQEPNATFLTAQFLGDLLVGDCVAVAGSLFDPADVDSYRVLIQESLSVSGHRGSKGANLTNELTESPHPPGGVAMEAS